MGAGFLTGSDSSWRPSDLIASLGTASRGTLTSLSRVGSQSEVEFPATPRGQDAAIGTRGGGLRGYHASASRAQSDLAPSRNADFQVALPSAGPYLRLLTSARAHLIAILAKSKHREAPLGALRERWDGGIAGDDAAARSRKARGEFTGVLPGRTRKWKQFYGLAFDWVLAECVGAGMIELFETGSVGKAARVI